MRTSIASAVICFLASLMWSCGEPPSYDEGADFHSIPADGWAYGDVLEFSPVPEPDSCLSLASIAVAVRHTDAYLYGNIWLELATPMSVGDSMRVDTVNMQLADVYGKWFGRGVGVSYMALDTLPGRYVYRPDMPSRLRHIMRVDTLQNIEQIGLVYFDITPMPQQPVVPTMEDSIVQEVDSIKQ